MYHNKGPYTKPNEMHKISEFRFTAYARLGSSILLLWCKQSDAKELIVFVCTVSYPGGKVKQLLSTFSRFVEIKKTFSKIASDRIGSVRIFCGPYQFSSNCKVLHFYIISGAIAIDSIWNGNRNFMMSNELTYEIPKILSLNVLFNYQIKHNLVRQRENVFHVTRV